MSISGKIVFIGSYAPKFRKNLAWGKIPEKKQRRVNQTTLKH